MLLAVLAFGCAASANARTAVKVCPLADPAAKELARTADVAAETYATEHNGYFTGITAHVLRRVEPALPVTSAQGRENEGAYLLSARSIAHGQGFIVQTRAADGDTYSITGEPDGRVERIARVHGHPCDW